FVLNGSSRHARIMAMGISIKTAEPIRAHWGRGSKEIPQAAVSNRETTFAYTEVNNAKIHNRDNRSFVSCISTSYGIVTVPRRNKSQMRNRRRQRQGGCSASLNGRELTFTVAWNAHAAFEDLCLPKTPSDSSRVASG